MLASAYAKEAKSEGPDDQNGKPEPGTHSPNEPTGIEITVNSPATHHLLHRLDDARVHPVQGDK